MATDEEIIEELNQEIEKAQQAEGFFITVSYREKDVLYHHQSRINFRPDDCILSLNEVEKLVREANPRTHINISRFKPRSYK